LIFDLETDGLVPTKIHCIAIDGTVYTDIDRAVEILGTASVIVGHNIIGFDIPAIQKFYPYFNPSNVVDTLVLSRLIFPNMLERDMIRKDYPRKLVGRHSLEAWGHRLGLHKGDYDGGWEVCSQEMLDYCLQDVAVTSKLYEKLIAEDFSKESILLEHQVAQIIKEQQIRGFAFDVHKAQQLAATLADRREQIKRLLAVVFLDWEIRTPFIPKVNNKTRGYVKGVEIDKIKVITFNPGSRDHVANRLQVLKGWKPKAFTPDGKPKIDEAILSKLDYPEAKLLSEYYMVQKRIGMLSEGNQAWLKHEVNGRIHGAVNTNGAITGRATHFNPNVAQVPSNGVPYGEDCRSLFTVAKDKVLVGIDLSGLELRCLAHYMMPYDNGVYANEILNGDIHVVNQRAAGLSTRSEAKTFIYALIYGAGAGKMGEIVGAGVKAGSAIRKKFLDATPALGTLMKNVQRASNKGFVFGIDGRKIKIRNQHSSLNALLQNCGAVLCKQFLVEFDKLLTTKDLHSRASQVAWIHDEIQVECDPDIADKIGELALLAIAKAGEHFKFRLKLDGEYNIGNNWAETH